MLTNFFLECFIGISENNFTKFQRTFHKIRESSSNSMKYFCEFLECFKNSAFYVFQFFCVSFGIF